MIKNFIKNWKLCDRLDAKLKEIRKINKKIQDCDMVVRGYERTDYRKKVLLERKREELKKQYEEIKRCH